MLDKLGQPRPKLDGVELSGVQSYVAHEAVNEHRPLGGPLTQRSGNQQCGKLALQPLTGGVRAVYSLEPSGFTCLISRVDRSVGVEASLGFDVTQVNVNRARGRSVDFERGSEGPAEVLQPRRDQGAVPLRRGIRRKVKDEGLRSVRAPFTRAVRSFHGIGGHGYLELAVTSRLDVRAGR